MLWIAASHRKEGVISYSSSRNHQFAKIMVFDIWCHFAAGGSLIHEPKHQSAFQIEALETHPSRQFRDPHLEYIFP
jgi:quinol monooxygenase YgiN